MCRFLLMSALIAVLSGCNSKEAKLAAEADRQFKDSIALADGNKVLGNIRFGVSMKEFIQQQIEFLNQRDTIYGYYIQDIRGSYTPSDQLYEVRFYGVSYDNYSWKEVPFRDFLTEKFGMESKPHNIWRVGDREIAIEREERHRSGDYLGKLYYQGATATHNLDYKVDRDAEFNFYLMRFTSDSLRKENERQLQEKSIQSQKEYEQRQQQQQEQNKSDVNSL